ncbi:MAG TPA: glycosyl hydrolase family 18 protein, partial [Verrucomicrobiae bacterium]
FTGAQTHYDATAQAAYFSITNAANSAANMFISYNDPRACAATASYVRNKGLGGFIIWELTQDHKTGQPDPLLQAIKSALNTPGRIKLQNSATNISLTFTGAPLGSYQAQWTSNLANWNNLSTTNLGTAATGGVLQVTDSNVGAPSRFYRIKSPP